MSKGKITLIATDEYGPAMGIRFLSAALKQAGYETIVVFAIGSVSQEAALGKVQLFSASVHEQLAQLAQDSLYVGISLITPTFHKAREFTQQLRLRLPQVPILWGGVHANVKPNECLQFADMVCVGEGENLVVELAERLRQHKPYHDIPGIQLPHQPSSSSMTSVDITHLPRPDYTFDGSHYLAHFQGITPFTTEIYNLMMYMDYYVAPTRGCPYKCTYCVHDKYAVLHKQANVKRFRRRDLTDVIAELEWAKANLPIQRIMIDDDCFLAIKASELRYFTTAYKQRINLPFVLRGAHPQNVNAEKLQQLCDAGMIKLRIGIQTGSERVRELYDRTWEDNAKIMNMVQLINQFIQQRQLRYVMYDIIVDNPWETDQDKLDTLNLVASLPQPFGIYCFSLTFYPGTGLYERALAEQRIPADSTGEAYWQGYWELDAIPINETLIILKALHLSPRWIRYLAQDRWFANWLRKRLYNFVMRAPEVSLFFKTRQRYEADFLLSSAWATHQDKYQIMMRYYGWIAMWLITGKYDNLDGNRLPTFSRRLLLNFYLKWLAPQ
jgi:radical SAM superfamily enzyme YgiQ (UPF0313 family)